MIERDWYGVYGKTWNGELHPDAYVHPAKVAYGLAERIYNHCLAAGYFKPGDTVLDPFFGVGGFAFHALLNGLNVVGVELEPNFVELARKNLELWRGKYGPGVAVLDDLRARGKLAPYGAAMVLQGDSRQLRQVVAGAQGAVSSPPWGNVEPSNASQEWHQKRDSIGTSNSLGVGHYGSTPSNLGNLPPGDFAKVVALSSPPYTDSVHDGNGIDADKLTGNTAGRHSQAFNEGYGRTEGQLGAMHAAIGSPPFADSLNSDDPDRRGGLFRDEKRRNDRTLTAEYGESEGQLGRMHAVGSPPWESSVNREGEWNHSLDPQRNSYPQNRSKEYTDSRQGLYGDTDGNLGNGAGDDFWSAAALIMSEVAAILPPGSCAVWVVKSFIRDGAIIDFPDQWRQLGESHGFETVETIKAWLVEDKGIQMTLEGGAQQRGTARKSFFRRLYENKHPENAIDYEVVLIQRKRD